ncbi:MAG TPA: hypothetical protein PKL75_01485 [Treponemataceae bacterium]|nr:hypothetical protein [Treponemataceae bacterium]
MKRTLSPLMLAVALFLGLFLATACFSALDPAVSSHRAGALALSLSALPGADASDSVPSGAVAGRAIVQGAAKLYVQLGIALGSATLHGPYDAAAGTVILVNDIPPDTYPWVALIYSASELSLTAPITVAGSGDQAVAFTDALGSSSAIADRSSVSFALLSNITVQEGNTNQVEATLIPLTEDTVSVGYGSESPYAWTASQGTATRRFIRLVNKGNSVPTGNALFSSTLSLRNTGGSSASFANAALYSISGSLVATGPSSGTVKPGESATLFSLSSLSASSYFLYLETTGTGFSVSADNKLATRLVAVTATGTAYWSEDGATWNGPYATGLTACTQATSGAGGLFAVSGSPGVATSTDGITWTVHAMPNSPTTVDHLESDPSGNYCAVTDIPANGYSYYSADGLFWPTFGSVAYTSTNAAYLDGKWYVTSSNGSSWKSSPDGVTWTAVTGSGSGMYQLNRVVGINGRLIAGGGQPSNAGTQIQVSTDYGATFAGAITIPLSTGYVQAFAVVGMNRLVVGGSSTNATRLVSVTDDYGASWLTVSFPGSATVNALKVTALGLFAGDANGNLYRSLDDGLSFSLAGTLPSAVRGVASRTAH